MAKAPGSLSKKASFVTAKFTADELERENEILKANIELPEGETVTEFYTCSFQGKAGVNKYTGKLYLARNYICFVGQKKFGGDMKRWWCINDILDLSATGTRALIILDIHNKTGVLKGFVGGEEGRDKVLKSVKRLFFGINGGNVLHAAVMALETEKIKQICDLDVSKLSDYNANEQTPLILACITKNDKELVTLILNYYRENIDKIDINQTTEKSGHHVLHEVCKFPDISDDILTLLLNFPNINAAAKLKHDNTTPLHYFCEHNHSLNCASLGELLIEKGADVNARNSQQETPLHKAIFNQSVRVFMVSMLLKHKASADIKAGSRGDTPLHYAIRLGRVDLIKSLLSAGADIHLKNDEDQNALEIAKQEYKNGLQSEIGPIVTLLEQVENLFEMLKRVELQQCFAEFVEQGLYDPTVLCTLDAQQLINTKIDMKTGPRIKLLREIQDLRDRLEKEMEEKREKEKERTRQRKEAEVALQRHLTESDARGIRQELGDEWEIDHADLEYTAKLGQGASGQVFRGLFRGREVAIKVLVADNRNEELAEFKKEFKILTAVQSRNIVKFFGVSFEPRLCMVMEFAEHGSLYDVLQSPVSLDWGRVISFISDMAQGLYDLHNHEPPVIHRDLKSLNLLVTKDWRLKVCDFGLSRPETPDQLATFHRLCGTFAYCAPEMFNGVKCTAKADVYSMGIVIWELLHVAMNGKYETPYAEYDLGHHFQIILHASQGYRPTIPPGSPIDIAELFQDCVHIIQDSRPTAKQVVLRMKKIKGLYAQDPAAWANRKTRDEKKAKANGHQAPQPGSSDRTRAETSRKKHSSSGSNETSDDSIVSDNSSGTSAENEHGNGSKSYRREDSDSADGKSPTKRVKKTDSGNNSVPDSPASSRKGGTKGKKREDTIKEERNDYLAKSARASTKHPHATSAELPRKRTGSQQRSQQRKKHSNS